MKNDGANLVKKVKGIFGFKVKDSNGNEALWIVDAKNGSGKVEFEGKGTHTSSMHCRIMRKIGILQLPTCAFCIKNAL